MVFPSNFPNASHLNKQHHYPLRPWTQESDWFPLSTHIPFLIPQQVWLIHLPCISRIHPLLTTSNICAQFQVPPLLVSMAVVAAQWSACTDSSSLKVKYLLKCDGPSYGSVCKPLARNKKSEVRGEEGLAFMLPGPEVSPVHRVKLPACFPSWRLHRQHHSLISNPFPIPDSQHPAAHSYLDLPPLRLWSQNET